MHIRFCAFYNISTWKIIDDVMHQLRRHARLTTVYLYGNSIPIDVNIFHKAQHLKAITYVLELI